MSIYFYSYPTININPGGPTYKTAMLYKKLTELGMDVKLFDMWNRNLTLSERDIFYIFTANVATWPMAVNLVNRKIPYVVNPIFYSNHSASIIKLYNTLEKPFKKILKRTSSDYDFTAGICEHAKRILPNTQSEGELLQKAFNLPEQKINVIHNGVEERFAEADKKLFYDKYGIKDFVLYTGHLGPVRKNGLNIIKAMRKSNAQCVIIGDTLKNQEGAACLDLISKSDNIKYLGWMEHDDPLLASAYAACHTYILPTRYETPGRAALEAGLAGANIVITPKGGTKEYFAEFALYPDPLNVDSIASSIEMAQNKKKNTSLKERILKNYIWQVIAEKTCSMFEAL